jgi:twitching motility protein PilT
LESLRILVVDDEPAVQRAEIRSLESAGHSCVAAASIDDARTALSTGPFDLALIDIRIGPESGLDLARLVNADFPAVGTLMVTGTADFTSVNDARRAGALDYLVKPVSHTELLAAITRAAEVNRRRQGRPAPELSIPAPQARPRKSDPAIDVATGPPIDRLFRAMIREGASDLHLSVGMPPLIRRDGQMRPLDAGAPVLSAEDVIQLLDPIVPGKNRHEFENRHDSDFAYEIEGVSRFRGNIFLDRRGMGAVFRTVPTRIVTAEELALSPAVLQLCSLRKGLVLVTGPTGSGKSTTLAALIDHINRTRADHIVTIEDPIEFVHANQRCLVNQREVHTHTRSFKDALRAALREDPDVVLIGEMRDLETVAIALETAETGHLVFGTLHTTSAVSTVDRIIDQFPADRQPQIRLMLADSLQAVIAQTLCRRVGGGRVAAFELLFANTAISNLIREAKTFQIPSLMQVGRSAGMTSLNESLFELVRSGTVARDEARSHSMDKPGLDAMFAKAGLGKRPEV